MLAGRAVALFRVEASVWPLLPLDGAIEALWRARPELVAGVDLQVPGGRLGRKTTSNAATTPGASTTPGAEGAAAVSDRELVAALLGREPAGRFEVVVRASDGSPVVIRNAPFLDDGTPMPTTFWLVGRAERDAVARLESSGGQREAEEAIGAPAIAAAHLRYAAARDQAIDPAYRGPRPSGGVGGTRVGVKCLHAHLAAYLAGEGDPVGRYCATRLRHEIEGPAAAIDCGTNSTRLLVVGRDGKTLERSMSITRLGAGIDASGALDPAAIERTLVALRGFRETLDAHGVVALRAVATSAARDASNGLELTATAQEVLGVELEILPGAEEGRLAFLGATSDLDPGEGPYLIVDLGGGSTELVTGDRDADKATMVAAVSLEVGCVRVTERFLSGDPPAPPELEAARRLVRGLVEGAAEKAPSLRRARRVVGVAGTVSSLAAMDLGVKGYDPAQTHHHVLRRGSVSALLDRLARLDVEARRRVLGLEPGRADVIVGGTLVLDEIMASLGCDEILVSEMDILDGLVATLGNRAEDRGR